jgi:hypothetical protein
VGTIATAGAAEAPGLELVDDRAARRDWREHLAARLAYGFACVIVAMLVAGEWERFSPPAGRPGVVE